MLVRNATKSTFISLRGQNSMLIVGRTPCRFDFTGSITSADGSALVRLGETTVLCGIRAEVAEPDLLSPSSGFLGKTTELRLYNVSIVQRSDYSAKLTLLSTQCRTPCDVLVQVPTRSTKR